VGAPRAPSETGRVLGSAAPSAPRGTPFYGQPNPSRLHVNPGQSRINPPRGFVVPSPAPAGRTTIIREHHVPVPVPVRRHIHVAAPVVVPRYHGFTFGFGVYRRCAPVVCCPPPAVIVPPTYGFSFGIVTVPTVVEPAPVVVQQPVVVPPAAYAAPAPGAVVAAPAPAAPQQAVAAPVPAPQMPQAAPAAPEAQPAAPPAQAPPAQPEAKAPAEQQPVEVLSEAATTQPAGAAPAEPSEQFVKYMNEGAEAFAKADFHEARRLFVQATIEDPNNIDAKLAYALTQFALGEYYIAAMLLREVIPHNPYVVYSDFDLRDRYGDKNLLEKQVASLRSAVREHPKDGDLLLVLGFVEYFTGRRDEAKATFEKALKISPDEPTAKAFLNPPPLPQAPTTQPVPQSTGPQAESSPASASGSEPGDVPTTRPSEPVRI